MKNFQPNFFPALFWLLTVTILLVLPGSAFPQENWLSRIWFDKWVHIGLFSLLVFFWCWGLTTYRDSKKKYPGWFLLVALAAVLYGAGMEFVQKYFIPNRSFDLLDIMADGIGAFAGWIYSFGRYIKK